MKTSRTTGSTKKLIMWYKVNELFSNGQTFSQISRNLGIDRHRVSDYVRMSESEFLSCRTRPTRQCAVRASRTRNGKYTSI